MTIVYAGLVAIAVIAIIRWAEHNMMPDEYDYNDIDEDDN